MYSNLIGSFPPEFKHASQLANLESDSPTMLRIRILRGKNQSDLSTYAQSTDSRTDLTSVFVFSLFAVQASQLESWYIFVETLHMTVNKHYKLQCSLDTNHLLVFVLLCLCYAVNACRLQLWVLTAESSVEPMTPVTGVTSKSNDCKSTLISGRLWPCTSVLQLKIAQQQLF